MGVEKLAVLEEKVKELTEVLYKVRSYCKELEERVRQLELELAAKDAQLRKLASQHSYINELEMSNRRFLKEREEIEARLEEMLLDIEYFENA